MDNPISRAEHIEFAKRMEEEHHRQNRRLETLENSVQAFMEIAGSVQQLATNMEQMLKEQERQGQRLEILEKMPAERWNTVSATIIKTAASTITGAVIGALIAFLAV